MDFLSLKEQCLGLVVASAILGWGDVLIVDFEDDQPKRDSHLKQDLSLFANKGPWRITSQDQILASAQFERAGELVTELLDGKTTTDLRVGPLGDLTVTLDESIDIEVFAMPDVFDPHPSMHSWTWFLSESCVYPDPSGGLGFSPRDERQARHE